MSYVKDLLKIREVLEGEVNNLLAQIPIDKEDFPLGIKYQDTEMSYAVAIEAKRKPHLVLVDIQSGAVCYDIEPDCIELEELAEIADKLHFQNLKN